MVEYIPGNEQDKPISGGKGIFLIGMLAVLGFLIYLMIRDIDHIPYVHSSQTSSHPQAAVNQAASSVQQIPLGFNIGGRINQMFFAEHAEVKKGQVLATLDKKPFEAELAAAQAQLQLAQAEYNNSIHIPTSNFNAIEAARANVETAQHVYDDAHAELEKRRSIMVAGQLDHVFVDDVQNEKDAELALQRARRELAQQEDAAGNARSRDEYKAAIQVAAANVAIAQANLADTQLIAPISGIIVSRSSEAGATVPANTAVYVLSLPATSTNPQ